MSGQIRQKGAATAAARSTYKAAKDEAEQKLQNLEKLRTVYDENEKLNRVLIPAAERTVEELTEEQERVSVPYDDVIPPLHCLIYHFYLNFGEG